MIVLCEREDCRLVYGHSTTTCMGWETVYDKYGNVVSPPDPNTTTTEVGCRTCNKSWTKTEKSGEVTYHE